MPYWTRPHRAGLQADDKVLVAAHGNSLRAIVKHLFNVSDAEIPGVEIPTGNPLEIELDDDLQPISGRYLDEARAEPLPAAGSDAAVTTDATADDEAAFMRRAIALARPRLGRTRPNPRSAACSCATARSWARRRPARAGGRTRRRQALAIAGPHARGAAAYVTLEPCGERTSGAIACADRLIAAGVARVAIACEDPSLKAAGRGLERMRAAGDRGGDGAARGRGAGSL